ncbi:MAG: antibiotic biosynthesis monooxygenase [Rubrobacteraceae bacterium]|nr:antibiotic biosynthesis monooxygenase [Rubrobacteraceae bacterium]
MAYVVAAKWTAKEGEEEKVLAAIRKLIPASRNEPGCLFYQPNQDPENPRVFFFYEIYTDEKAYEAHGASEHFQRYGLGEAIPALESRERSFYQTIDV